jgi:hypothetical protein
MRPAKVKVMGRILGIKYVDGDPLVDDEQGECNIDKSMIYIKDGLEIQQERSAILHETIHAIDFLLNLKLTEEQVLGLEAGLYQVNTDNPRFFTNIRKI